MNAETQHQILLFLIAVLPIAGVLWKVSATVQALVASSEKRDLELRRDIDLLKVEAEDQADRAELIANGLRERLEHCNVRLSGQIKECDRTIKAIENWLQKNTAYERRSE